MENEWKLLKLILNELESIDSLNGGGGTPVDLSVYITTQYFNNSLNSFRKKKEVEFTF